mmetsp:Transcript_4356/g.12102  ORF Transcript_4356/g.12102 Transcript_4356/m.12102 type:complete len:202 (+) Transcript_4356:268-873(+)
MASCKKRNSCKACGPTVRARLAFAAAAASATSLYSPAATDAVSACASVTTALLPAEVARTRAASSGEGRRASTLKSAIKRHKPSKHDFSSSQSMSVHIRRRNRGNSSNFKPVSEVTPSAFGKLHNFPSAMSSMKYSCKSSAFSSKQEENCAAKASGSGCSAAIISYPEPGSCMPRLISSRTGSGWRNTMRPGPPKSRKSLW